MDQTLPVRTEALLAELALQRNAASDRAVAFAGELAVARAEVEALKKQVAQLQGQLAAPAVSQGSATP